MEQKDVAHPVHHKNDGHLKFLVCHDGSKASIAALNTTVHGYMSDTDHLLVAHAWSRDKEEYLPYNLKREYIKQLNDSEHLGLGSRYIYLDEEAVSSKHQPETPKEVLNRMAV
jgi:hypothetical protein